METSKAGNSNSSFIHGVNMMGKKVLVVGGAGFIGSHLAEALIDDYADVTIVDSLFLGKRKNLENMPVSWSNIHQLDASKKKSLIPIVHNFDIVYNLAVLPLPHSLENPFSNFDVNVKIVQNLLELQREGCFKRLIHFSSSEVYGTAEYEPMCERHPLGASTPYAAAKAACDLLCLSYHKTFGSDVTILRPFNAYGPRQNKGNYAGVIPLTIERIKKGQNPLIYGDGRQTRDYTYVEDIARAAVLAGLNENISGEIINVGSGHDIQILWLVSEIWKLMLPTTKYVPPIIRFEPARPGDVRRHIANPLKAKDLLGWEHRIGMEEGLRKTIDWYYSQNNIF